VNVRARYVTLASGLFVVVAMAISVLGSVDAGTTGPTQFSGWTGQITKVDEVNSAAMTPDDAAAISLLAKAVRAASSTSFTATVKSSTPIGSSRVTLTHMSGGGTSVMNGASTTWLPAATQGGFVEAGKALSLLATNFRVIRNAALDAQIARRSALAVDAFNDNGDVVARFWFDASSGLLIRKDTLAPRNVVVSTYEYTSLSLVRNAPASARPVGGSWGPALTQSQLSQIRAEGCGCPDALPGKLSLVETHVSTGPIGGTGRAIHQVFSDGIAAVSLFFVTGGLVDEASLVRIGFRREGSVPSSVWVRPPGAASDAWTAVWEKNGRIVTAIVSGTADDRRTLEMITSAESPALSGGDPSLMGRMIRGWQRLVGVLG